MCPALLADYARIQLLSFLYKVLGVACPASMLFVFAISARTRILVVPAHRSLASSLVVLSCRAWNALPHGMKVLPTRASFVSTVKRMVRGIDASN
jgi:hypothetical protein